MMDYSLQAAQVIAHDRDLADAVLTVSDATIADIGAGQSTLDLGDAIIAPGMIDIHIHGREGCDVMDADPAALHEISASLARHGVTGFLATTATAAWERTMGALAMVGEVMGHPLPGARLLGAYSEGIFFSEVHKGAHNEAFFLPPSARRIAEMQQAAGGSLKVVALAPEREGAMEAIRYAVAQGIRVVLGHTDATYDQTMAALEAGASGGVHVFNGMRGIHHRDPGCAGAVLFHPATVEVIADDVHLHPAILSMITRLKAPQEIMLISDCMCAGGLHDGDYRLGEMDVKVTGGVARTPAGGLAGSTLTLDQAVGRMMREVGLSLREAWQMASLSPAHFLDIAGTTGSIAPGKQADLAIMDADHRVRATIVGGTPVWIDADWQHAGALAAIAGSHAA
jgi:N-acetylglucosamine-6-phosphate deacetylase